MFRQVFVVLLMACSCLVVSSSACLVSANPLDTSASILSLKATRTNCVEVCKRGKSWRLNTYWYSIIPLGTDLVMINDSNKKYAHVGHRWRAKQAALQGKAVGVDRVLPARGNQITSSRQMSPFLSGERAPVDWHEWKFLGRERLGGLKVAHHQRVGTANSYAPPADTMSSTFQAVIPGQAFVGISRTGNGAAAPPVMRNVRGVEDLWVVPELISPELATAFNMLFGCEMKFGLPVQNVESIKGVAGRKAVSCTVKYLEFLGQKTQNMKDSSFRLPQGYKKVPDYFQVMLDDEGSEQFIYREPKDL